jgi:leader peptidase (prepilin peptidase) / N-methyltransferase
VSAFSASFALAQTIVPLAAAFAVAGLAGALLAERLCEGRVPYDDGPASFAVGLRPFAALGACAGVAVALHGEPPLHVALLLVVTLALSGCAAADLACGVLPDVLTLGPLAIVVAVGAATHELAPAFGAALVAAPFAVAALATRGRGMGWGDVKLAALGGALLGAPGATVAYMLAALAAYAVARRTAGARRPIAFGPYLAASIAATLALVRTP